MGLLIDVAAVFAACAIAAFTARTARERGRSRVAWGALSAVAGLTGLAIGGLLFARALAADGTDMSLAAVAYGVIASLVAPLGAMLAVLGLVTWLPERVPAIGGARWQLYRLSSAHDAAGACELAVDGDVLCIGERRIAAVALVEIVADGECLRVAWDGGAAVLMPDGDGFTAKEKAKRSQAIAQRLRQLLAIRSAA